MPDSRLSQSDTSVPLGVAVTFARGGGVRLEAAGAVVDALYRAHLAAYGLADEATKDCFRAVVNREAYVAQASPEELLSLAWALDEMGMRRVSRELRWHEAHERAEELRDQAADLEAAADRLERVR